MAEALGANHVTLIRQFVERIEAVNIKMDGYNADKAAIFTEAKDKGFNTKVLKRVIQDRRRDAQELRDDQDLYDLYIAALDKATPLPLMQAAEPKGPPTEAAAGAPAAAGEAGGPDDTPSDHNGTASASLTRAHAREDDVSGDALVEDEMRRQDNALVVEDSEPPTAFGPDGAEGAGGGIQGNSTPPAAPPPADDEIGLFGEEPAMPESLRLEPDQITGEQP